MVNVAVVEETCTVIESARGCQAEQKQEANGGKSHSLCEMNL